MQKSKQEHVMPLLKELGWPPVKFWIQYKIVTFAYHHFEGSLPPYLSVSVGTHQLSHSLWSSHENSRSWKPVSELSVSAYLHSWPPSIWKSLPAVLIYIHDPLACGNRCPQCLFTFMTPSIWKLLPAVLSYILNPLASGNHCLLFWEKLPRLPALDCS